MDPRPTWPTPTSRTPGTTGKRFARSASRRPPSAGCVLPTTRDAPAGQRGGKDLILLPALDPPGFAARSSPHPPPPPPAPQRRDGMGPPLQDILGSASPRLPAIVQRLVH